MSSPDTNPATESGAISLEVVPSSHSGDATAPASPTLSHSIAYRMISRFAVENLRQAADALDADMPELARHHTAKAVEQLQQLQTL